MPQSSGVQWYDELTPSSSGQQRPSSPSGVQWYDELSPQRSQPQQSSFLGDMASSAFTVPNAIRTGFSLAGDWTGAALSPLTGGLSYPTLSFGGGAIGEGLARWYEGQPFNPYIMATEGALNLMPGPNIPGAGAGLREIGEFALKSGGYGALQGLAGAAPRHMAEEGRIFEDEGGFNLPSTGEVAGQTLGGGVFGTGFGGLLGGAQGLRKVGATAAAPPPVDYLQQDLPIHELRGREPIQQYLPEMGQIPVGPVGYQGIDPNAGQPSLPFGNKPLNITSASWPPPVNPMGQGLLFGDITPPPTSPPMFFTQSSEPSVPPVSPAVPPARVETPPAPIQIPPTSALAPVSQLPDVVTITKPATEVKKYLDMGYVPVTGLRDENGWPQMVRAELADLYRSRGKETPTPSAIPAGMKGIAEGADISVPNEKVSKVIENLAKEKYKPVEVGATHTLFRKFVSEEEGSVGWPNRPPRVPVHGDEEIPDLAFQADEGVASQREFSENFLPGPGKDVTNPTSREEINRETEIAPEGSMNEIIASYPSILEEAKNIYNETDPRKIVENLTRYSAEEKAIWTRFNEARNNLSKHNIPIPEELTAAYNRIFRLKGLAQAKYERASVRQLAGRPETVEALIKRFLGEEKGTFDPWEMFNKLKQLLGRPPTKEEVNKAMEFQAKPGETTGRVAQFDRGAISDPGRVQDLINPTMLPTQALPPGPRRLTPEESAIMGGTSEGTPPIDVTRWPPVTGPFAPPVTQPKSVTGEPRLPEIGPMGEGIPRNRAGFEIPPQDVPGPVQEEINFPPSTLEELMDQMNARADEVAKLSAPTPRRLLPGDIPVPPEKGQQELPLLTLLRKKFMEDESGTFDPEALWNNLRKALGREPTEQELIEAMQRQGTEEEFNDPNARSKASAMDELRARLQRDIENPPPPRERTIDDIGQELLDELEMDRRPHLTFRWIQEIQQKIEEATDTGKALRNLSDIRAYVDTVTEPRQKRIFEELYQRAFQKYHETIRGVSGTVADIERLKNQTEDKFGPKPEIPPQDKWDPKSPLSLNDIRTAEEATEVMKWWDREYKRAIAKGDTKGAEGYLEVKNQAEEILRSFEGPKASSLVKSDPMATNYIENIQRMGPQATFELNHKLVEAQSLILKSMERDLTPKETQRFHELVEFIKSDPKLPEPMQQSFKFDQYELPDGTKFDIDATNSKGAPTIDYKLKGGEVVKARRIVRDFFTSEEGSLNINKDLMNKFLTDESGGIGGTIKEKTGWGMGSAAPKSDVDWIGEVLAVPSSLTVTGDLSAPGRQGLSMILTPHFWRAVGAMYQGISEKGFDRIDRELKNNKIMQRPFDEETGKFGQSIGEQIGTKMYAPASKAPPSKRAQQIASRWLETGGNIPYVSAAYRHTFGKYVRGTNRAYLTFLNHLNVNRTEFLLDRARDMSLEALTTGKARPGILKQRFTPEQAMDLNPYHNLPLAKDIADFVNTATGHAPLKTHLLPLKGWEVSLESSADKLSKFMFAPGLLASRVRMLNPNTYFMATPFVRKQYMKAAISTGLAWYAFTELSKMAGGDEVTVMNNPLDPEQIGSADFGKVRIGNTRMDPGGGFLQFAVFLGRFINGGYASSSTGEYHRFGEGFQAETELSNATRFFSNKLNPAAKFAWDLASASEYKPFHIKDRTMQMFVPLVIQDLWELYNENPKLLPWMAFIAHGMGTQTYEKGESVGKFFEPENDILYEGGGPLSGITGSEENYGY